MRVKIGTETVITALLCMAVALGCGTQLLGIGDEWTKEDCSTLNYVTFAEGFVCSGNAKVCHHTMLASYHTGMAICLGLSDEDPLAPTPAE